MKMAIDHIEPLLEKKTGGKVLPTVIIATVKGDIHDIGKNLVALMLKNYGYQVMDLGKDVTAEDIVETALRENAAVIGLSALMTTTMMRMGDVVELAKQKGCKAKILVGGACITEDFAKEIGADDSSFANPEGWDDENNYSTVQDLAIIARYAKSQALIAKIASTVSYTTPIASGGAMTFNNSNFLLHEEGRFYHPDVTGLKTGSTSGAGKCLVATVNIDGHNHIAIVMGCPNEETRYTSMLSLITYIEEYDNLKFA
jgi:methylmalonyl-CoA mutase cobalamin-binding domain/chain